MAKLKKIYKRRVLPHGWKEVKISDVFKTGSGATPTASNSEYYTNGTIPWINSGELCSSAIYEPHNFITQSGFENSSTKLYPIDTVLIAMYGATAGKTSILKIPACTNQAICAILPHKDYSSLFIKYYIENLYSHLVSLSSGSARDNISQETIKDLKLFCPSTLESQTRLIEILNLIDRKIALNREINRNLEAMARQLYDYWFVQFDFPDENGQPYKSCGGKMVWNEKLKREIPEGWIASNILAISDIRVGGTPSKTKREYWLNGTIPFFGPTDVTENIYQLDTADHITDIGLAHCASSLFSEGDIILTARGSIGKLVIVGKNMAMNQSCYALSPKYSNTPYLFYLSKELIEWMKAKGSGSVFKSFNAQDVENSMLCIAPQHIIERYSKLAHPIFNRIKTNIESISELQQQRDELLPLLMNGQVSVMPTAVNCDLSFFFGIHFNISDIFCNFALELVLTIFSLNDCELKMGIRCESGTVPAAVIS